MLPVGRTEAPVPKPGAVARGRPGVPLPVWRKVVCTFHKTLWLRKTWEKIICCGELFAAGSAAIGLQHPKKPSLSGRCEMPLILLLLAALVAKFFWLLEPQPPEASAGRSGKG